MVVPESPNNEPLEVQNQKAAEVTTRNLQADASLTASNFDLDTDDGSDVLGALAISKGDASTANVASATTSKDAVSSYQSVGEAKEVPAQVRQQMSRMAKEHGNLASMGIDEIEKSVSIQRAYASNLESQLKGKESFAAVAGQKQQADKMLEANTYFANFA